MNKASLEEQLSEMENNWKRALADYQNLQKRAAEEKISFAQYANAAVLRKLLPIMDSLEKMAEHFEDESLNMVLKDFYKLLEDENVEEIGAEGTSFDPTLMEAIEMVPGEQGKVIEVVQKGYTLKDRLLRPAKVNVGLGGEKVETPGKEK
jgi:molecular chaperone GrpE